MKNKIIISITNYMIEKKLVVNIYKKSLNNFFNNKKYYIFF